MAKGKEFLAVCVTRNTTVGGSSGGSVEVEKGDVLLVGRDVSKEDALYLCAIKKAVPCDPAQKAKREKSKQDPKE